MTSFELTSDLLVEWNPLAQQYASGKLLGYTIYYRDYNIAWSTNQSVYTSGHYSRQVTLTGLKPAHRYLVAVAAFTSKGEGPWSAHEYAITGISQMIVLSVNYSHGTINKFKGAVHVSTFQILIKRAMNSTTCAS